MLSLNGILTTADSALAAQRAAIATTGNNIANAQTAGYSRQIVQLGPNVPESTPQGIFGTGVRVDSVRRARSELLDSQVRAQVAPHAQFQARSDLLGSIENVFGEPSSTGLASSLDAFYNAWSSLAADPVNPTAKTLVQQSGQNVAGTFNRLAGQISGIGASARAAISDSISKVNTLTSQIADVNAQLVPAESGGHTANDLRDQRDRLIDQLSALVPVNVIDYANGGDQIMIGGLPIVDGLVPKGLSIGGGVPLTVNIIGNADPLRSLGGSLGAMVAVLNNDLANAQSSLDALASSLITDINYVHAAGWSPPSGTSPSGIAFFDATPSNATAKNIQLSVQVTAKASVIATGAMFNTAGDNSVASAIAALRDFSPTAPGGSMGTGYQTLVSSVATAKSAATDSSTVYQTLSQQATQARQATSGVSTDEELVSLMGYQQAYSAAAKVVQTVSQMMQTLIDMKQ